MDGKTKVLVFSSLPPQEKERFYDFLIANDVRFIAKGDGYAATIRVVPESPTPTTERFVRRESRRGSSVSAVVRAGTPAGSSTFRDNLLKKRPLQETPKTQNNKDSAVNVGLALAKRTLITMKVPRRAQFDEDNDSDDGETSGPMETRKTSCPELREKYPQFTSQLGRVGKVNAMRRTPLLRIIEDIYDARFAQQVAYESQCAEREASDGRGRSSPGAAHEVRQPAPFPDFCIEYMSKRYGLKTLMAQHCWGMLASAHMLRIDHVAEDVFSRFLDGSLDGSTDLVFYMNARRVSEGLLKDAPRIPNADNVVPSQASTAGTGDPLSRVFFDAKQCITVVRALTKDESYATLRGVILHKLDSLMEAPADGKSAEISVDRFLRVIVDEYQTLRTAQEEEDDVVGIGGLNDFPSVGIDDEYEVIQAPLSAELEAELGLGLPGPSEEDVSGESPLDADLEADIGLGPALGSAEALGVGATTIDAGGGATSGSGGASLSKGSPLVSPSKRFNHSASTVRMLSGKGSGAKSVARSRAGSSATAVSSTSPGGYKKELRKLEPAVQKQVHDTVHRLQEELESLDHKVGDGDIYNWAIKNVNRKEPISMTGVPAARKEPYAIRVKEIYHAAEDLRCISALGQPTRAQRERDRLLSLSAQEFEADLERNIRQLLLAATETVVGEVAGEQHDVSIVAALRSALVKEFTPVSDAMMEALVTHDYSGWLVMIGVEGGGTPQQRKEFDELHESFLDSLTGEISASIVHSLCETVASIPELRDEIEDRCEELADELMTTKKEQKERAVASIAQPSSASSGRRTPPRWEEEIERKDEEERGQTQQEGDSDGNQEEDEQKENQAEDVEINDEEDTVKQDNVVSVTDLEPAQVVEATWAEDDAEFGPHEAAPLAETGEAAPLAQTGVVDFEDSF